jgi:L-amino acid N-acyltransferase
VDGITIRDATEADVPAITDIQNALLATTTIEWTDQAHTVESRVRWLWDHEGAGYPVLVAVDDTSDEVVGWAAYGDFRDIERWPGYRFTVENTVHVRESHWSSGVGRALMLELIERARAHGRHSMVAAVTGENEASIRFHERLGFELVGRLPQVGSKLGRWLDVVFLHLPLDDRALPPPD